MAKSQDEQVAQELTPQELLTNFLKENNLRLELSKQQVRHVENGAVLIEHGNLVVTKNG